MAAKKKAPKQEASAPPIAARAPEAPPEKRVKIANQEYGLASVDSLRLHPKNPKKGNVDAIGQSLEENDFYGAILVQKSTGYMLAGNHRWKSAREKGLREVPVIYIDCDDAKAEKILLADNRIADLGTYDDSILLMLLEERSKEGSLAGTGYGDADLERMKQKLSTPEQFPEFDEQVKVHYKCPRCLFTWS